MIWIHGGGWQNGNKGGGPALALLEQGFAVATINYRLSGDAIFPAQIHDCKAAVRHLRGKAKEYGIDPERFGVWGSSAGGHLVALVGTSGDVKELEGEVGEFTSVSSRVQAVCDWFGPTDFLKMGGRHDDAGSPESKLIGGPIQDNKELVAKANPITYVSADDPAFLIQHGDKDPAVPYNQSELGEVPLGEAGRRHWLREKLAARLRPQAERYRQEVLPTYGPDLGKKIEWIEVYEISEYAAPLTSAGRARLFPFVP